MKTITIRIEDSLYEAIKAASEKERRSISNWIALILRIYLDNLKKPSE